METATAQPESANGIELQESMSEAGQPMKLETGSASRAAEVHEAPDRSGEGEGEVAILSGEGLQANHVPPEQQEPKFEPAAGMHIAEIGMHLLGE